MPDEDAVLLLKDLRRNFETQAFDQALTDPTPNQWRSDRAVADAAGLIIMDLIRQLGTLGQSPLDVIDEAIGKFSP